MFPDVAAGGLRELDGAQGAHAGGAAEHHPTLRQSFRIEARERHRDGTRNVAGFVLVRLAHGVEDEGGAGETALHCVAIEIDDIGHGLVHTMVEKRSARDGRRSLRRSSAMRAISSIAVSNSRSGSCARRSSKARRIASLPRPLTAMMK